MDRDEETFDDDDGLPDISDKLSKEQIEKLIDAPEPYRKIDKAMDRTIRYRNFDAYRERRDY